MEARQAPAEALIAITHVRLSELMRQQAVKLVCGEPVFMGADLLHYDDGEFRSICITHRFERGEP